jgi:glucuronoarabinoxylan endo-1,4-beta-xylanase
MEGGIQMSKGKFKCFTLFVLFITVFASRQTAVRAANGTVKVQETHQTMVGFGASVAYYNNWLAGHINKAEIYYQIFDDLGLDILRLSDHYRNNPVNFDPDDADIVTNMYFYTTTSPQIMISSWSPPADIKSNGSLTNGGTLLKVQGEYVYGAFARYWIDALAAYNAIGIVPDYISIQNEPSYVATWESCIFNPVQNSTNAGYNRALDSVYYTLQQLAAPPMILAPEVLGIGYNAFQNYATQFNHDHVDGYAYHLYHGESDNVNDNHNPDLFIPNLTAIAAGYGDKPIFQTEYDRGDWFNTAWLIQNCLVYGNVSAYLYWGLVWDASSGSPLIGLENPWNSSGWTTPGGFILRSVYWAFRQYARFIDVGWKRVTATSDAADLRISAFINPAGNNLTLVILNVGSTDGQLDFDIQGFEVSGGSVVRTSDTEQGKDISDSYLGTSTLDVPVRSISTVSFFGRVVDAIRPNRPVPAGFSLSQNYPNPFNPRTTIEFNLAVESFVQLKIFNSAGQEIRTLLRGKMPAGRHRVPFNAGDLGSGIYLYRIKAGDFEQAHKMILIK